MDIIDALVKRMVEDEDLLKGVTPRKVQKMLDRFRQAKNPNLSPKQRQQAIEEINEISGEGKSKASAQSRIDNLDRLMAGAKDKTATDADRKLAEMSKR